MVANGGIPTLSEVRRWGTAHLTDAADHWTMTATVWEDQFTELVTRVATPGGTRWEGQAAEAAQHRAHSDRMTVIGLADQLHTASGIARRGATEITEARRLVLRTVESAESAGFTVGESFSVTDPRLYDAGTAAVRQSQAEAFAIDLRARVGALLATDSSVAGQLTAATDGLGSTAFADLADGPSMVQLVDYKKAPPTPQPGPPDDPVNESAEADASPSTPLRGLPPADVRPPIEGPLAEGPASRARERRFGGRSLWDENGGEWRYFPGDEFHNPHWDYNPHSTPSGRGSDWVNVPIGDMPPRIAENPTISALPPWLQGPLVHAAPTPGQNPLLTPFPGASISSPPRSSPGVGPTVLPHINLPDLGDLQPGSGPAAVLGGGALVLALLGAMAIA